MKGNYMYPMVDEEDRDEYKMGPAMSPMMQGMAPQPGMYPPKGCPMMQGMMAPSGMYPMMGCPMMQGMMAPSGMYPMMGCPMMQYGMMPYMSQPMNPWNYPTQPPVSGYPMDQKK